jgi:hypothetical protein
VSQRNELKAAQKQQLDASNGRIVKLTQELDQSLAKQARSAQDLGEQVSELKDYVAATREAFILACKAMRESGSHS